MSVSDAAEAGYGMTAHQSQDQTRGLADTFDDANPEYDELDSIAPLPLYQLIAADSDTGASEREKAVNLEVFCFFSIICLLYWFFGSVNITLFSHLFSDIPFFSYFLINWFHKKLLLDPVVCMSV